MEMIIPPAGALKIEATFGGKIKPALPRTKKGSYLGYL